MKPATVLIVDDEADILELLEITLKRMGIQTRCAINLKQAHDALKQQHFDLCLTDMRLPDGNGLQLVEHLQQQHPELPVAVITAHGNVESAVEALKKGAFDFVSKPVDLKVLRNLINTALKLERTATPTPQNEKQNGSRPLLGHSKPMMQLRRTIAKLARNQAPVYICGESGTGKELAARQIHQQGPRAQRPFIAINCGAIPSELMESEFFGHLKGSFSGAVNTKDGLFQAAEGGTLFLDEVADLPLAMQVKLLRAIQEKRIRPIGSNQEKPINVRLLSASHKDLADEVQQGHFRQDLYYRLNVIELTTPPLRERPEDIEELAHAILQRLAPHYPDANPNLSKAALFELSQYEYPGNVRELENMLERALALQEGEQIEADDLQLENKASKPSAIFSEGEGEQTLEHIINQQERHALMEALEKSRWKKSAAAQVLGISYRQLRYRLKKMGIE
ncbi:MAG: sigma-54 dependent transcriptional regulator [Gammaproteobacteria bacterium]|nr:sigma-54 dependent transcriptional regulator [Gammaproteobacteria bacterium]